MKKSSNIGERFKGLRKLKGISQAQLAEKLHTSRSAVSAWEVGDLTPPPEALAGLGNLAGWPECLWLWKLAGVDEQAMLSAAERELKARGVLVPRSKFIRIPRLSRKSQRGASARPQLPFPLPAHLVPNPGSTFYIELDKNSAGEAFADGDIVVVDRFESQKDPRDAAPFWQRLIVVEMSAPSDANRSELRYWREGTVVGRLQLMPVVGFSEGIAWVAELHLSQDACGAGPVVVGKWAQTLSPEELRRLELPENEELEARAVQESADRAYEKIRLYEGCEIVGEVILVIPAKAKRRFHYLAE